MNLRSVMTALAVALALAMPALAAPQTPVASKDGSTYTVEDFNIYWLRNLGPDGLLDFLQTMAVYQEGIKQNLRPSEAEIDEFIDTTMGRDIFEEFTQLFSERAVMRMIEYTLVTADYEQWLRDKIRREQNITVTENEARDYFLENIDLFHLPEGVYISLISVDNQTQAEAVHTRLQNGENFNDIAGEVNMDAQMRAARGELGVYRRGDGLPQPIEDAAFALSSGQYSQLIKGANYHIVYCHQRSPEVSPGFDELSESLMLDLLESKIDEYYFLEIDSLWSREIPRFSILTDLFRAEDGASLSSAASPDASSGVSPLVSKDGIVYTLEDLSVYWLRNLGKDGLVDFLQAMVIYQEGIKQNLRPSQAEIDDYIDNMMGREVFGDFTKLFSERACRQMVEYTLVTDSYERQEWDRIFNEKRGRVPEDEAQAYFDQNRYRYEEGARLSMIQVANQSEADAVLSRLAAGEDFNAVAAEVNTDLLREVRGEIGVYRRVTGELTLEEFRAYAAEGVVASVERAGDRERASYPWLLPWDIEDAALGLTPGTYSRPIAIDGGYLIVFKHEHVPATQDPRFDMVRDEVISEVAALQVEGGYQEHLIALMTREVPRFTIQADLFKPEEQ